MSESPYYTQYSTIKEDKEILLAQAGEHISKINAIAKLISSLAFNRPANAKHKNAIVSQNKFSFLLDSL